MEVLVENPLAVAAVGGLLIVIAATAFAARRTLGSLVALAAVIAAALGGLAVERLVVTQREEIESALAAMLAAIEANDVPALLAWIDPAASAMRADAAALLPQLKVEKARMLGAAEVRLDRTAAPWAAECTFRALLQGVHARSGMQVAYFNQRVDIRWIKLDGKWLMHDYAAYYDDRPINAVESAAGNRPVP